MRLKNTNFGIVTDFYGCGISLENAVLRLNKLGIRDLEIPGWHWSAGQGADYIMADHPERLNGLRGLLNDLGMNVQQFHSADALAADSENHRAMQVEKIRRSIDLAAELGTKALVIHIGGRHNSCAGLSDSAIFEANAKSLSELARHTADTPVRLAIENLMSDTNRTGCRISELKELIASVGSDRIGICFDAGHALMMSDDAVRRDRNENADSSRKSWNGQLRFQHDALGMLAPWVVTAHLHDNDGHQDSHDLVFRGVAIGTVICRVCGNVRNCSVFRMRSISAEHPFRPCAGRLTI